MTSSYNNRLKKMGYRLGLLKPYWQVDSYRYLKRLGKRAKQDWRYCSSHDVDQFDNASEIVVRLKDVEQSIFPYCDPNSRIKRDIIKTGGFQKSLLDLLIPAFREGEIFLDVGANIGYFSILAAKQFKDLLVHAYEPHRQCSAGLNVISRLTSLLVSRHLTQCAAKAVMTFSTLPELLRMSPQK
ncbi:MAG: hypothetical protein ABIW48_00805 [Burkholderiales bacterium]